MDFVLTFTISNIGIVTNILVIVVFAKQGFKESVNISMTTIAIWDLLKCLAGAMQRMAGPMSTWSAADAESWTNIGVVVFNYLICYSSYITSVLAAYVAVERCLCVCIPFKVKWLLTPKVVFTVSTVISFTVLGLFVVMWGIYDIVWVYNRKYNCTVAVYVNNKFYFDNEYPLFQYYNLSGILWPLISFVVIVVCTLIIMYKLKQSFKFRSLQADVKLKAGNQLSTRDKQVVKMLLVIVGVYVVSLSPRISHYLAKYIVHEFYFLRLYHNFFVFICYFLWLFDLINGACNFFVFFAMSSSFRKTFYGLFRKHIPKLSNSNTQTSEVDAF
ncbi:unnamed protein product [Candidula unifasciata]|uniref:G-protein coupled receptors family 1 profile domain-containing protein n=1 Tax=Candidula unifasciata TaxID=100452 RepID=A0A8S3ZQL1_9EUPU|nr:unnamed protein product [Candidula unifasciata]